MKALVLAGGRGSRLTEFTKDKNKSMIDLFGKPVIEYNLERALEADVTEIIIVVGYKKEKIMEYFGKEYQGIKINYVFQKKQKGLVNAIECAKKEIGDSDFILMLGDEVLIESNIKRMIKKFREENLFAICGIVFEKEKSSIGKTYSSMVNEKGRVFRLIEKPAFPINNIKGTGHCIFKNEILEYLEKTPISMKRGERELVDMIQEAVDEGKQIYIHPCSKAYININTREDYDLARKLIENSNPKILIIHPQMEHLGGAELLVLELCNWLTKRGIKNDLLTNTISREVEKKFTNTNIILLGEKINIGPTGFATISDILKFIKICRKKLKQIRKNYDVINFHNFPATWTLFPRKKPCVWMLNEPPNLWSRPDAGIFLKGLNKIRNWVDKLIVRNSVEIICVADTFNQERALERYGMNSKIVYYGVNHSFFSKGNAEKAKKKWNLQKRFIVIQSGVLTEVKNQMESLKTINLLKDKIPNILLVLAGKPDPDYKKKLERYIQAKNLEKYILFTGNLRREELRDLYKASDIGLSPIGKQGGWLAPFETLCAGTPIIVSPELGASSVIEKYRLGKVTSHFANAVLEIRGNSSFKTQAKRSSIFLKKYFGWDRFTDKLISSYKEAWKEHK